MVSVFASAWLYWCLYPCSSVQPALPVTLVNCEHFMFLTAAMCAKVDVCAGSQTIQPFAVPGVAHSNSQSIVEPAEEKGAQLLQPPACCGGSMHTCLLPQLKLCMYCCRLCGSSVCRAYVSTRCVCVRCVFLFVVRLLFAPGSLMRCSR